MGIQAQPLRERLSDIDSRTKKPVTGYGFEETKGFAEQLLRQLYWAFENLRWAEVHLFYERFKQVKSLPREQQNDLHNPPQTKHQNLLRIAVQDLATVADTWMKRINGSRIQCKDMVAGTRELQVYRSVVLKHCDPRYQCNFV
jgi:hypothetical protein